ncbi:MAG: hypothetical protein IKM10_00815 [Bacteroidaceae bacterium]|nr:hypothetical protein [Bacteroidaceae bacterium]
MPYRRLPNTDTARIGALRKAIDMEMRQTPDNQPASFKTLNEAKVLCSRFEAAVKQFRFHYDEMAKCNKRFQPLCRMARLYVSHFIQVLNMTILRNEIKAEYKELYQLSPDDYTLPDLASEKALVEWGQRIIDGENKRLAQRGGTPIYNPTIAKVRVHYDIFIEARYERDRYKKQMQRSLDQLNSLREEIDALILKIWDEVESHYNTIAGEERIEKCRKYGIIYYYRKNEKRPI